MLLYVDTYRCPPVILSHPQNVEVLWGHAIRLAVEACGASPLHYQWYFEKNELSGMLKLFYVNHA